jgi:hypothetical protein
MLRAIIILTICCPLITNAQDKMQHFSTGPKDVRKYVATLRHLAESISRKQAAEEKLRSFFGSTIYEMKNGSLVIFQGEGPDTLIAGCRHDTAIAAPFVKFVTEKIVGFFHLSFYLPKLKETMGNTTHIKNR